MRFWKKDMLHFGGSGDRPFHSPTLTLTLFTPLLGVGDLLAGDLIGERVLGDLGDGVRFRDPGVLLSSYRPYRLKWKHIEWIHEQFEHKDCCWYSLKIFRGFSKRQTPSMNQAFDYFTLTLIFLKESGKKERFKIETWVTAKLDSAYDCFYSQQ